MLEIYKNIKAMRQSKEWTQDDLANRAGYTGKAVISYIEAGKIDLPLSRVYTLADALGCTVADLLGIPTVDGLDRLDPTDLAKAVGYIEGLLSAEKYKKDGTSKTA